jgi:glyoxylase-like metal-dependent hydrolase (beta-lactamase superfamily II)
MAREQRRTDIAVCPEIAPGVYGMEAGSGIMRSNVYFVRSGASWVLLDAASANCGQSIREAAESLFGGDRRPASILLTHCHPDHAGSARELARMWDCPVYVHPDELPVAVAEDLATIAPYANPLDRWVILPVLRAMGPRRAASMIAKASLKGVARAFDPGAALPGLPDWDCVPTPGHTPGHVAYFRARDRVLISGDALLTVDLNSIWGFLMWSLRRNRPRVAGPPWYTTWDRRAAKDAFARLLSLQPRVLASGHGRPITAAEGPRERASVASQPDPRSTRSAADGPSG